MARPFWSGHIQISLVSFGVKLFPAIETASQIRFHQIDRKTGERVRHQKVSGSDEEPVDNYDIVKGYEYSKGEYIQIEPSEIAGLRIASRSTIEIQQFVGRDELAPAFFEKPYFVLPENDAQADAFAVVQKALQQTEKLGIGKIAVGDREHLIAISAPSGTKLVGLMGYFLRYAVELRDAGKYFSDRKTGKVDEDQLALAKELIKRKTQTFDPRKFTDDYEVALHELVDAKLKHIPLPKQQASPRGKVIDLMEALRRSVKEPLEKKKPAARAGTSRAKEKPGPRLIQSNTKAVDRRRKSA
ncbi:MAG: Ku protein [Terracidiphilus sp.]|jgi:DNA end-binding protein Ku